MLKEPELLEDNIDMKRGGNMDMRIDILGY